MARRQFKLTEEKIRKLIAEGRGQGEGAACVDRRLDLSGRWTKSSICPHTKSSRLAWRKSPIRAGCPCDLPGDPGIGEPDRREADLGSARQVPHDGPKTHLLFYR